MEDLKAFRRVCHNAATQTSGTLTEFRVSTDVTPNFHQGIVSYPDRTIAVVCIRYAALLALAAPRVIEFAPTRDTGPLTFIDDPELAAALAREPTFRLLTAAELNGPIDAAQWPTVSEDDIRYWQPKLLGEALFNYWD
jgi:hypothetical protein